jgi:hypothetical protein
MNRRTTVILEIVGLAVVLFTTGWEFFVERTLNEISQDASFYRIERKLDDMWFQVGAIRYKVEPNSAYSFAAINPAEASKNWPFAGDKHEFDALSRQTRFAKNFRGIGFLFGSLILLLARGRDLLDKYRKAPNDRNNAD